MIPSGFQRACPVCQGSSSREVLRKEVLRLVRCEDCGMVYANPVAESMASGEFYDQLAAPFYLSPDKLEGDYAPVRFERELKIFRRFCPQGRVLDVGCSTGAFLAQLRRRFGNAYDVLGMDVAGPALEYAAKQGVPVRKGFYLTASLPEGAFSAVTFWAVLEHLIHPREFLAKTATLLVPGGHCFVLVPNFESLAVRCLGPKYRYILPQHVNYFTLATLCRLATADGRFEFAYTGCTHFNPLVLLQDWRRGPGGVPDEERARLLKRTTAYKQNFALKPAKWTMAGMEWILGRLGLADNLVMVLKKKGE